MNRVPCRKFLLAAALLVFVIAAGKDFAATWWLKQSLPDIRFSWAKLNPLNGSLSIYNLDCQRGNLRIQVPRLQIKTSPAIFVSGSLKLTVLRLDRPAITLRLDRGWQAENFDSTLAVQGVHIKNGRLTLIHASGQVSSPIPVTAHVRRSGDAWQFNAQLGTTRNTIRLTGSMDMDEGRFDIQGTDIPVVTLGLPQLMDIRGRVSGKVAIHAHFNSSVFTLSGWVRGANITFTLPGRTAQQTVHGIRIAGSYDSSSKIWRLHSLRLDRPHLRLAHLRSLTQPARTSELKLYVETLFVSGGIVDLLHTTPVGDTPMHIADLTIAAHDFSLQRLLPTLLATSGRVNGGIFTARLQHGRIDGHMRGIDLHTLDPMLLALTGHRIHSGSASAILTGFINEQQLDAIARFDIANLIVGPRIPVHGATPVISLRAAVASLTDINGHTRFPVRIRGPVTAPRVSLSRAADQAISNATMRSIGFPIMLLLRTLTNTPRVLHQAIGFRAAGTELSTNGRRTLRTLIHILREHPELTLEIRGCAYPKRDGEELPAQDMRALATNRARRVWREIVRNHISPDRIHIVYPSLWLPSPHLAGLGPRVEASLLPSG